MIISFAGHSFVSSHDKVKELVKRIIRDIITDDEAVSCYLGGYGDFDNICASACRELKEKFPKIELVYITPYLNSSALERIKVNEKFGLYDTSIYPPLEKVPPKFAISRRNEWMIKSADIAIFYVNHRYGGAYKSLVAAERNKKKIINVCDFL